MQENVGKVLIWGYKPIAVPVGNLIRVARTARIECPTVNPIRLVSDSESGNAFARWPIFAD